MAKIEAKILVAKMNAVIEFDGRRIVIKQNITTARENHPVVRTHPDLWKTFVVQFDVEPENAGPGTADPTVTHPPVSETMTDGPDERRSVKPPTRRGPRTPRDAA